MNTLKWIAPGFALVLLTFPVLSASAPSEKKPEDPKFELAYKGLRKMFRLGLCMDPISATEYALTKGMAPVLMGSSDFPGYGTILFIGDRRFAVGVANDKEICFESIITGAVPLPPPPPLSEDLRPKEQSPSEEEPSPELFK